MVSIHRCRRTRHVSRTTRGAHQSVKTGHQGLPSTKKSESAFLCARLERVGPEELRGPTLQCYAHSRQQAMMSGWPVFWAHQFPSTSGGRMHAVKHRLDVSLGSHHEVLVRPEPSQCEKTHSFEETCGASREAWRQFAARDWSNGGACHARGALLRELHRPTKSLCLGR
jgi:hypothetical protein